MSPDGYGPARVAAGQGDTQILRELTAVVEGAFEAAYGRTEMANLIPGHVESARRAIIEEVRRWRVGVN
jgi:hypothetical protein